MFHAWSVSVPEATRIQRELREQIVLTPLPYAPRTIAGVDISFSRYSDDLYAGVLVFSLPDMREVDRGLAKATATFPYVPGYLSFREIPALMEAWKRLEVIPDVVMADGHGIAHPRRLGIATHLSFALDVPSFGCGKRMLYGIPDEVEQTVGSIGYIRDAKADGEIIGALVRTKKRARPVIISPGNRITLEESLSLTRSCLRGYRLPEPTRRAHLLVNAFRRGEIRA